MLSPQRLPASTAGPSWPASTVHLTTEWHMPTSKTHPCPAAAITITTTTTTPQVHDEVMLEGPEGSAEAALARVVACMENPWNNLMGLDNPPLRVQLAVDANIAGNWYEAK